MSTLFEYVGGYNNGISIWKSSSKKKRNEKKMHGKLVYSAATTLQGNVLEIFFFLCIHILYVTPERFGSVECNIREVFIFKAIQSIEHIGRLCNRVVYFPVRRC